MQKPSLLGRRPHPHSDADADEHPDVEFNPDLDACQDAHLDMDAHPNPHSFLGVDPDQDDRTAAVRGVIRLHEANVKNFKTYL